MDKYLAEGKIDEDPNEVVENPDVVGEEAPLESEWGSCASPFAVRNLFLLLFTPAPFYGTLSSVHFSTNVTLLWS